MTRSLKPYRDPLDDRLPYNGWGLDREHLELTVPDPFDRAYGMLAKAEMLGRPTRGLAMPFDVKEPDAWQWRVSVDMMQALYNASVPVSAPNPKSGDDGRTRLFGLVVVKDRTLPPDSMLLEPTDPEPAGERPTPPYMRQRSLARDRRAGCSVIPWLVLAVAVWRVGL